MIGLDCNILVQLAIAEHPANASTVTLVQREASHAKLVVPSLVATEFLHVVTDPKRFAPPLTMEEALTWIDEFVSNPGVVLLEPTAESFHLTTRWMRQFSLGRKRILDTHLAAVLHTANVPKLITSNPADFAVFNVLTTITPASP